MKKGLGLLTGILVLTGCHAVSKTPPTQVVYRFDDHRYLELEGFNCEGALWYSDTQRNIHTEVSPQFYRIFTKKYVHPSEKYIAITYYDVSGVMVSKDYGQTWHDARFTPGGGAKRDGSRRPSSVDVKSFTVINDQGFIQTKSGDLYISSKPFDDPRMMPGGRALITHLMVKNTIFALVITVPVITAIGANVIPPGFLCKWIQVGQRTPMKLTGRTSPIKSRK